MRTQSIIALIMAATLLLACTPRDTMPGNQSGIANPASEYCVSHGGKLEIITAADGSQQGSCTLNGTTCDEWAFYRGECPKCGECPQLAPASPDFCKDGRIVPGTIDACGCQGPPSCIVYTQ